MSSHSSTSTSIIAWITASAFFLNVIFSNEGAEHSLWQITYGTYIIALGGY